MDLTETSAIAKFVADRVEELRGVKQQNEIAREAGYKSPNMITMIKQGNAKVAIDRVPDLAKALDVDPTHLLRLAMDQFYTSNTVKVLMAVFKNGLVTQNERAILNVIRTASGNTDPAMTPDLETSLRTLF
jgi:transcriptional regulator with XRE-family HTH domain